MSSGLAVAQKTITDTFYKEGEPQKVITERAGFSQYVESKHIQGQVTRKKNIWEEKVHKQDVNFERIVKQSQFCNM